MLLPIVYYQFEDKLEEAPAADTTTKSTPTAPVAPSLVTASVAVTVGGITTGTDDTLLREQLTSYTSLTLRQWNFVNFLEFPTQLKTTLVVNTPCKMGFWVISVWLSVQLPLEELGSGVFWLIGQICLWYLSCLAEVVLEAPVNLVMLSSTVRNCSSSRLIKNDLFVYKFDSCIRSPMRTLKACLNSVACEPQDFHVNEIQPRFHSLKGCHFG
ncbi:hypothetical protein QCA50_018068 [Cerrena zonata]|uniref:Uncharacterized protein n=1 Tax=Cerrena zonata TaxID=2478898 RepID=A0AAW0FDT1_9APHY